MTDLERSELQLLIATWRRYVATTFYGEYADGREDGMRDAASDLEDFLCRTEN